MNDSGFGTATVPSVDLCHPNAPLQVFDGGQPSVWLLGMFQKLMTPPLLLISLMGSSASLANDPMSGNSFAELTSDICFDLPLVVQADMYPEEPSQLRFELALSSFLDGQNANSVKHWLIFVQPRTNRTQIIDYAPRTRTSSKSISPIVVKEHQEQSESAGAGIKIDYAKLAGLHAANDHANTRTTSREYQLRPSERLETASGSINRGKGVYFKLLKTDQQILEGEKRFNITLQSSGTCRSELVDVTILARGVERKFNTQSLRWKDSVVNLSRESFVVAVHRRGDQEGANLARSLMESEQTLRNASRSAGKEPKENAISLLVKKLNLQPESDTSMRSSDQWIDRVIQHSVDPNSDKTILALPLNTRVAILDYLDARTAFLAINQTDAESTEQNPLTRQPPR